MPFRYLEHFPECFDTARAKMRNPMKQVPNPRVSAIRII